MDKVGCLPLASPGEAVLDLAEGESLFGAWHPDPTAAYGPVG